MINKNIVEKIIQTCYNIFNDYSEQLCCSGINLKKGLKKMKRKLFRRILSTVLTAVMVLSVFAVSGISAGAVTSTPEGQLSVVIKGVTRRYNVANSILSELNSQRSKKGESALLADEYLFNKAMERAAQLAIDPSTYDLIGESYNDDGSGKEVIGVIDINLSSPMGAAAIIQQLITDSAKFHINDAFVSEALYDNSLVQIGVGAVYVEGNENTVKGTNKLFVCLRMSDSTKVQKAYDPDTNNTDIVVDQATVINASYFTNGVKNTVVRVGDDTTDKAPARVTFEKDGSYQILDKYTQSDITQSSAYFVPKVIGSGVKATNAVPTTSSLYPSAISYCTRFTPTSGTFTPVLHYESYLDSNHYEKTFGTFTATGEFSAYEFDESSIELEYERVYYVESGSPFKPAVTVKDKNSGAVLVQGTDYRLTYTSSYSVPNSQTPEIEASVKVTGKNNYAGITVIKKYYIVEAPTNLTVSMRASTGNSGIAGLYYPNEVIEVIANPSKTGTNFNFTCKGPDGNDVTGSASMSGTDGRFLFTPAEGGKYTVTVNAVCGTETATASLDINVAGDLDVKLTVSDTNPSVGTKITINADISGGQGTKTVVFKHGYDVLTKTSDTSAEYTPSEDETGIQTIKCTVTDENGRSKTFSTDIVVAAAKTYPTVYARNLALNGEIGVNLYFKLPSRSYTVVMDGPSGVKNISANEDGVYQSSGTMRGYYLFTYGVPVADMSYDITVTVLDENNQKAELYANNGTENIRQTNDTYTVSVNNVMEATVAAYPKYKDLAEATYSYGAYANKFFRKESVNDSDIKNLEEINKVTSSTISNDLGTDCQVQITGSLPAGVTFRGFTLLLDERTSIKVYVDCTDPDVKFMIGNDEVALQTNGKNTYLCQDNISVTRLGEPVSFIATKGTSSYGIFCSPMSYAYIVLSTYENTEKNQDLCQLIRAMYCYYVSAQNSLTK